MSKIHVGIDLGTTYSVVAVYKDFKAEILDNEQGNRLTPSCVAFTDNGRVVGEGALDGASKNPKNTILASKRLIGRSFKDPTVQADIPNLPFSVVEDDGKTKIQIKYKEKMELMFPEEIAAAILEEMQEIVYRKYQTKVKDVVISIPAYFDDAQRQATKDAATIAGLNVLHLIHEPTAAAMAYALDDNCSKPKTVLVYDLGGGTFDVSVLVIDGSDYTVKAVKGDTHLGGEDFDKNLVDYFVKHFKKQFNRDISDDPKMMSELKKQCEKSKRLLSTKVSVDLELPNTDLEGQITRAKFEYLNEDLFERTIELVEEVLKDAKLQKSEIDEVILVGGSSRIIKVQEMLSEFFDGKTLNITKNPDEVVALGAAISAGKTFNLKDVCPLSLSNRVNDGSCVVVIQKNTQIPATMTKTFVTVHDNQENVLFTIFEGERKMAEDNTYLGEFSIKDLPKKPRGEVKFDLTFNIDKNGILTVTAVEPTTGKTNNITISNKSRLTREDAERFARVAAKFKKDDKQHEERLVAYHKLEDAVYKKLADVKKDKNLDVNQKKKAKDQLQEYLDWIDANQKAKKEEFEKKMRDLEQMIKHL